MPTHYPLLTEEQIREYMRTGQPQVQPQMPKTVPDEDLNQAIGSQAPVVAPPRETFVKMFNPGLYGAPVSTDLGPLKRYEQRAIEGKPEDMLDVLQQNVGWGMTPFVGGFVRSRREMQRNQAIEVAAQAEARGRANREQRKLLAVARAQQGQEQTFGGQVAQISTSSLPFMLEFVATSGLLGLGAKGTTFAIGKVLGAQAAKASAAKAAGALGGYALQFTAIAPSHVYEGFNQRWAEQQSKLEAGEDADGFIATMTKAFGDTFIEVMSERTGGLLGKLPGAQRIAAIKGGVMMRWLKNNPSATIETFLNRAKSAAAWDGILGEVFEERVADVAKTALLGDELPYKSAQDFLQQMLAEGTAFTLPAIAGMSLRKIESKVRPPEVNAQHNVLFRMYLKEANGNEQKAWELFQKDIKDEIAGKESLRQKFLKDVQANLEREQQWQKEFGEPAPVSLEGLSEAEREQVLREKGWSTEQPLTDIERQIVPGPGAFREPQSDIEPQIVPGPPQPQEVITSDQEVTEGLDTVLEGREPEIGRAVPDEGAVQEERAASPVLETPGEVTPDKEEELSDVPSTFAPKEKRGPDAFTVIDPNKVERDEHFPIDQIEFDKDVQQFKEGADEKGVVRPLEGKFERLGIAPIVLWRRLNGKTVIVTGRHRLDLAKRSGEKDIHVQIVNESDGYTKEWAMIYDAQNNIRDEKGSLRDYALYFRNTKITKEQAREASLLQSVKGYSGFILGKNATDNLYDTWRNGEIKDAQAVAIAESAPRNDVLQKVGLRKVAQNPRISAQELGNLVRMASVLGEGAEAGEQTDLFGMLTGEDIEAEMERRSKIATRNQREVSDQLSILVNAQKIDKKKAKNLGVDIDINDPVAVEKKRQELRMLKERWAEWHLDPELRAIVLEQDQPAKPSDAPASPTPGPAPTSPSPAQTDRTGGAKIAEPDEYTAANMEGSVRTKKGGIIHPSTREPGTWQHTYFTDEGVPAGHDVYPTLVDALAENEPSHPLLVDLSKEATNDLGEGISKAKGKRGRYAYYSPYRPIRSRDILAGEGRVSVDVFNNNRGVLFAESPLKQEEMRSNDLFALNSEARRAVLESEYGPAPAPTRSEPVPALTSAAYKPETAQEAVVVDTLQQLPGEKRIVSTDFAKGVAKKAGKKADRVRGFHHKGVSYFSPLDIVDWATEQNIPVEVAATMVWGHEVGIHGGLKAMIPDATKRAELLSKIRTAVGEVGMRNELTKARRAIEGLSKDALTEEYLAYIGEQVMKGEALNSPQKKAWTRFVAKVKAWLRGLGVPVKDQSHVEKIAASLIQGVREGVTPILPDASVERVTLDSFTVTLLKQTGLSEAEIEALPGQERDKILSEIGDRAETVNVRNLVPNESGYLLSVGVKEAMYTLRFKKSNQRFGDHITSLSKDRNEAIQKAKLLIAARGMGLDELPVLQTSKAPMETNENEQLGLTGKSKTKPVSGEKGDVDTKIEKTPVEPQKPVAQTPMEKAGLTLEQRETKEGKPYWSVSGNLAENKDILDQMGFGRIFQGKYRSLFQVESPEAALNEALQTGSFQKEYISEQEALAIIKQKKLKVRKDGNRTYVSGKTYDVRGAIGAAGGEFSRESKEWVLVGENATQRLGTELKRNIEVDAASREEREIEEAAQELRAKLDSIPDTSAEDRVSISSETAELVDVGTKYGIPEDVVKEQKEDVESIVSAYKKNKPMYILANEAGTGKTFILGGAIRELRNLGAKKFVWVTQSQDLIAQAKRDLKSYGIDDVVFHTYAEMSTKKSLDLQGAVVLFDEAQNIKNAQGSERGRFGQKVIPSADFSVFASATPFENPAQIEYLSATGIFDGIGRNYPVLRGDDFHKWAKAFGANIEREEVVVRGRIVTKIKARWSRHKGADADAKAARDWFIKQGMMSHRPMKIDPSMVDVTFRKTTVEKKWIDLLNKLESAYERAYESYPSSQLLMHRENVLKRVLEASKIQAGIERAREYLKLGKRVVIFVETKADRTLGLWRQSGDTKGALYTATDVAVMMKEWRREAALAARIGDTAPPPPFAPFIEVIANEYDKVLKEGPIELPSVKEMVVDALGRENVALYTGEEGSRATKEKEDFMSDRKKVIVATMAKGGTGLSLHDIIGTRPTVQININLPWTASLVAQVSGRVARYGLKSKATIEWIFAENYAWESEKLAPKVGSRMRDMGALVKGIEDKAGKVLTEGFDFTQDVDVGPDTMFAADVTSNMVDAIKVYGSPSNAVRAYMNQISVMRKEGRVIEKPILNLLGDLASQLDDVELRKEARRFIFDTARETQQRQAEFKSVAKKKTGDLFDEGGEQGVLFAAEYAPDAMEPAETKRGKKEPTSLPPLMKTAIQRAADLMKELEGGERATEQDDIRFAADVVKRGRIRRTVDELVASAESMKEWKDWYVRHKKMLPVLFGEDAQLFQDMLSATSQRATVPATVTFALKAYYQYLNGEKFTGFLPPVIANLNRAVQDQQVRGPKISQFFDASRDDSEAIPVDMHIGQLLFNNKRPTNKQIIAAKVRIRKVAAILGWQPRETQAALWALNQVRLGADPSEVHSYDKILEQKADFIRELRAKFGRGEGGSVQTRGDTGERTDQDQVMFAADAGADPGELAEARAEWREKGTESRFFKRWFRDSKVVDKDGKPARAFHGTKRPDRVGNKFDPRRATSGPMAFFTSDPELGSKYAQEKSDTSLDSTVPYAEWFKMRVPGRKNPVNIGQAWNYLTPEQRQEISQKLPHVVDHDVDGNEMNGYRFSETDTGLTWRDHWDWVISQKRGNVLAAAVDLWLDSGTLIDSEQDFLNVLKVAGIEGVEFESPKKENPAVYPVYLSIQNPLDTSNIPQEIVQKLRHAAKRKRGNKAQSSGDLWDKRQWSGAEWIGKLEYDIKNGTTHAWTSIPDWVTDVLRANQYDGIKDFGGKMGGKEHNIWIPFSPSQIKSATANVGTFDAADPDIRFAADGGPDTSDGYWHRTQSSLKDWYSDMTRTVDPRFGLTARKAGEQDIAESWHSEDVLKRRVWQLRYAGYDVTPKITKDLPKMKWWKWLPAWKYQDVPQMLEIFTTAEMGRKWKYNYQASFYDTPEGKSELSVLRDIEKKSPEVAKRIWADIVKWDQDRVGYQVVKDGELYSIKDTAGNTVMIWIESEQVAWETADIMRSRELMDSGYTPEMAQTWLAYRHITHRVYDHLQERMNVVSNFVGESNAKRLKEEMDVMGQHRGYFFPRTRSFGRYVLYIQRTNPDGTKEQRREHYTSKWVRNKDAIKYRNQGYKTTLEVSRTPDESMFEAASVPAMDTLIATALERAQAASEPVNMEISDYTTKQGDKEPHLFVYAPNTAEYADLMKAHGGQFYQGAWHFKGEGLAEKKETLTNQIEESRLSGTIEINNALVEQLTELLHSHTSRATKIKRSDATGDDVWTGYEENVPRAIVAYGNAIAAGSARNDMAKEFYKTLTGRWMSWAEYQEMRQAEDPDNLDLDKRIMWQEYQDEIKERRLDPAQQGKEYKEAVSYIKEILRNQTQMEQRIAQWRGLTAFWYLSGVMAPAVVNLTGMVVTVLPAMRSVGGIQFRNAPKLLSDASKDLTRWAVYTKYGRGTPLSKEKMDLLNEIYNNGWMSPQYHKEAMQVAYSRLTSEYNKLIEFGTFAFGLSEQYNRASTILASYYGLKAQGMNHEDALIKAKEVSDAAHGTYGPTNYMNLARGSGLGAQVMRSGFMFKYWTLNYLELLKSSISKKDYKSAAYLTAAPVILAGPAASAITPLLEEVVQLIFKAFGLEPPEEPLYDLMEHIEKEYGTMPRRTLQYGLFGMLGANLQPSLIVGLDDVPTNLTELLGAPFSLASDFFYGMKEVATGDALQGARRMSPRIFRHRVAGIQEAQRGLMTRTGKPIYYGTEQVRPGAWDTIVRMLEFNPVGVSEKTEKQWSEQERARKYTELRTDIYRRVRLTAQNRFPQSEWANILADVQAYNARVMRQKPVNVPYITPEAIRREARSPFIVPKGERLRGK